MDLRNEDEAKTVLMLVGVALLSPLVVPVLVILGVAVGVGVLIGWAL